MGHFRPFRPFSHIAVARLAALRVLMKMPFAKTVEDLSAEAAALQASGDALAAELARLDAARPDLILSGEVDEVAAHDAARSRIAIRLEQAEARCVRLEDQRRAAEAEAEQDRRRKLYAAAKKRRAEGVAALASYQKAGQECAAALRTLAAVEADIADCNDQLPVGVEPMLPAEDDNSVKSIPDRREGGFFQPFVMGREHISVRVRATIPTLIPGEFFYNGPREFYA